MQDIFEGLLNDVEWGGPVDKIEYTHNFAFMGLEFIDLELAAAMCFPLHPDSIDQSARG